MILKGNHIMDSNGFNNTFDTWQTNESYETPTLDKGAVFAQKIRGIFASSAFLTATIAYTVMTGSALIIGTTNIFSILFTIGMWLAYTSAGKPTTPLKEIKFLSGVLKAYYIVSIIGIVFLVIAGVLLVIAGPSVMKAESEIQGVVQEIDKNLAFDWGTVTAYEGVAFSSLGDFLNYLSTTIGVSIAMFFGIIMIVMGVIFIFWAVISVLVNEFFIHNLIKQMKKATAALELGTDTELKLKAVRVWFIVIGAFSAVSALSLFAAFDFIMLASDGASAVACFALASALSEKENATPLH